RRRGFRRVDDHPPAPLPRPLARRSRACRGLPRRAGGVRGGAPRRAADDPRLGVRRGHPERRPGRPRRRGSPVRGLPDGRLARERLRVPGEPPMSRLSVMLAIGTVTARGLAARWRRLLMLLVAGAPVILGAFLRIGNAGPRPNRLEPSLEGLLVSHVVPLVALCV